MSALATLRFVMVMAVVGTVAGLMWFANSLRLVATAEPYPGTVTNHRIERHERTEEHEAYYTPIVTFTFQKDGNTYSASHMYPGRNRSENSHRLAELELARWPIGSGVTAHVPGNEPSKAFLVPLPDGFPLLLVFGPIALFVFIVTLMVQHDREYVRARGAAFVVVAPVLIFLATGGAALGWTLVVEGTGGIKVALWIAAIVLSAAIPLWIRLSDTGQLEEPFPTD